MAVVYVSLMFYLYQRYKKFDTNKLEALDRRSLYPDSQNLGSSRISSHKQYHTQGFRAGVQVSYGVFHRRVAALVDDGERLWSMLREETLDYLGCLCA